MGSVPGDVLRQCGTGIGTSHGDAGQNQRGQVRSWIVVFEDETKNHAHQYHKVQAQDDGPVRAQGGGMAARQEKLRAEDVGSDADIHGRIPPSFTKEKQEEESNKAERDRDETAGQKRVALGVRGQEWRSVRIHIYPCG